MSDEPTTEGKIPEAQAQPEPEGPKEVRAPVAWGDTTKKAAPKRWSAAGRGDDPTVRVVHTPLASGIGDGKAFFFLFGFKRASQIDQMMLGREMAEIDDDIDVLRKAGYTVVVDPQATKEDFVSTVTSAGDGAQGLIPAGFYWSAHGHMDGGIECCDGGMVYPTDLEPGKVAPGLRLAIFGACYVGSRSKTWKTALGGHPLVVGWGRPVTIDRAVDFLQPDPDTDTDLDDLIARWLLTDEALPANSPETDGVPESATPRGRVGALADRVGKIAEMLGARFHPHDNYLHLEVPLPDRRSHMVELFLIDSNQPFIEGEVLIGAEGTVGELSALFDPIHLLAGVGHPGYGRIALVKSETEMPRIVSQGFAPFARSTDQDIAAMIFQVAEKADALENKFFGGDGL